MNFSNQNDMLYLTKYNKTFQYNIRNYPNLIFYKNSKIHSSSGYKSKDEIMEFIDFALNPSVIELDYTEWENKIQNKKLNEVRYYKKHYTLST